MPNAKARRGNGGQVHGEWSVSSNMSIQQTPRTRPTAPACPSCGRICEPGKTWKGANYCRGLALLAFIAQAPGLSAWELSKLSGLPYKDTTRGLEKLREYGAVTTEREEIEGDRFRYKYFTGSISARQGFLDAMSHAEPLL